MTKEKPETPPEHMNIEALKMLKALDNPVRRKIVNYILSKQREWLKEDASTREDEEEC